MSLGRLGSPTASTPAATAPDDTTMISCPSARSAATSPHSLVIAAPSIAPRSSVIDAVPIFATTLMVTGLRDPAGSRS